MKKKPSTEVKYTVWKDSDFEATVIVEDGGIASCHFGENSLTTTYYQSRIEQGYKDLDDIWNAPDVGKQYTHTWKRKQVVDDKVIMDMVHWLYCATEKVHFVQVEIPREVDALRAFIKHDPEA